MGNGNVNAAQWRMVSGIIAIITMLGFLIGVGYQVGNVGGTVDGLKEDSIEFKGEMRDLKQTEQRRHEKYTDEFKAIRHEQKADTQRIIDKIDGLDHGRER